jgi:hypothetical protein
MDNTNRPNKLKGAKKKEGLTAMAGDLIERLGEFVTRSGYQEWGQKIYRAGNRLEHMNDKKAQRK